MWREHPAVSLREPRTSSFLKRGWANSSPWQRSSWASPQLWAEQVSKNNNKKTHQWELTILTFCKNYLIQSLQSEPFYDSYSALNIVDGRETHVWRESWLKANILGFCFVTNLWHSSTSWPQTTDQWHDRSGKPANLEQIFLQHWVWTSAPWSHELQ